ncbi:hypothetical protein, partial [Cernens ardua]|uniref:hypothetical protein n=1 Tax=Cernens ardua TaxID=3402176 RepID=UPI003F9CDE66
ESQYSPQCQAIGKMAMGTMTARQNGEPEQRLMKNIDIARNKAESEESSNDMTANIMFSMEKAIASMAYDRPVYKTQDDKTNAEMIFAVQQMQTCEDQGL